MTWATQREREPPAYGQFLVQLRFQRWPWYSWRLPFGTTRIALRKETSWQDVHDFAMRVQEAHPSCLSIDISAAEE